MRQWAGHDPAVTQRDTEIQKPERLVGHAVCAQQKAELDKEAAKMRRVVETD
jgi:hypothetical protein